MWPAKAAPQDGSGGNISRAMLTQPWPGTAWGELSSGVWKKGPRLETAAGLQGTLGFTRLAGPLCSLAGGRTDRLSGWQLEGR